MLSSERLFAKSDPRIAYGDAHLKLGCSHSSIPLIVFLSFNALTASAVTAKKLAAKIKNTLEIYSESYLLGLQNIGGNASFIRSSYPLFGDKQSAYLAVGNQIDYQPGKSAPETYSNYYIGLGLEHRGDGYSVRSEYRMRYLHWREQRNSDSGIRISLTSGKVWFFPTKKSTSKFLLDNYNESLFSSLDQPNFIVTSRLKSGIRFEPYALLYLDLLLEPFVTIDSAKYDYNNLFELRLTWRLTTPVKKGTISLETGFASRAPLLGKDTFLSSPRPRALLVAGFLY